MTMETWFTMNMTTNRSATAAQTALYRLIDKLDAEFAENGDSRRYHDYRDEIFSLVDSHPELAPEAAEVIPV